MVQFKIVISDPKTGKSEALEVKEAAAQALLGRKIGEVVDGSVIGYSGRVKITGGSDRAGFPMRGDVLGGGKNYVLLTRGIGFRSKVEGLKKRKLARGNTVSEEIFQINATKVEDSPRNE